MTVPAWPVDRSEFPALPAEADDGYDQAVLEQRAAAQLAVDVMFYLSARQYGLFETVVRPCPVRQSTVGYGPVGAYLLSWEGNNWVNWPCGCTGGCSLSGPRVVHLRGPVNSIVEVKIAGAVLDPSEYVLEGNLLYRKGGPWPGQDRGRPAGEANTWTVTYLWGYAVPEELAVLTGLLAREFLDSFDNEGRCRLPRTVTTTSRQGVTYRVYDPAAIYGNGKTGIPEIDLWLAGVNPNHIMAAPTVL